MGLSPDTPLADSWTWGRALRFADGPDEVHLQGIARMEIKARPYEPGKDSPYLIAVDVRQAIRCVTVACGSRMAPPTFRQNGTSASVRSSRGNEFAGLTTWKRALRRPFLLSAFGTAGALDWIAVALVPVPVSESEPMPE